jgi:hypothetical protein
VKDKEYGREVTGQVRQLVRNLNEVSAKIDKGNGSAAKLINDPQIYDAVNDILVGVNQSKFLRWLIRNRQNKGIEKRYKDTTKAIEESGGKPEPLDEGNGPKPPALLAAPSQDEDSTAPPPPADAAGPMKGN